MSNLSGITYYSKKKGLRIGQSILDYFSGCLLFITNLHHHIHEGKAFVIDLIATGIANNAYLDLELITPPNEFIHVKNFHIWISEGPIVYQFLESPTITTGITPIIPANLNRTRKNGSVIESSVIAKINPTGISGGNIIRTRRFGVNGQGSQSSESKGETQIENVLNHDTTYVLRIQNVSGQVIDISTELVWYE